MKKDERQFSRSKEWLDWLNDESSAAPAVPASTNNTARAAQTQSAKLQTPPRLRHNVAGAVQPRATVAGPAGRVPTHNRQAAARPTIHKTAPSPRTAAPAEQDAVVVNFHLPTLRLPRIRLPWKRVVTVLGIAVPVGIVLVATPYVMRHFSAKRPTVQPQSQTAPDTYVPLQPAQQQTTTGATGTGTVQGVQYDASKQLYKYNDVYLGVKMTISQQPLPDELRDNSEKLKKLAASIGANEAVTTTNGTVYISTDTKLTTQRLVFASKQVLIFIQADGILTNANWVTYIQSLSPKV